MRYLAADIIYPMYSPPVQDQVLVVREDGRVEALLPAGELDPLLIQRFSGALLPGFINAHCHLELSHLLGQFPQKTGLPEFLMLVTRQRETDPGLVREAMQEADAEMWREGIVAVGDISNVDASFHIKAESKMYYHTFIELIALDPARAYTQMESGKKLYAKAKALNITASLAPHAPYSVSEILVREISAHCAAGQLPTCIHMLESNDENEFYVQATGLYRKLYRDLGINIGSIFTPTGKTSLESMIHWFHSGVRTQFVHNTIATAHDIELAEEIHPNLFWCFCPNANKFIEDRLPDIPQLMQEMQYVTIGTDSLASNTQLSILKEVQAIHTRFPGIPLADLLRWATYYGAVFLGMEDRFGCFTPGTQPGILLLQTRDNSLETATIQRLI